LKKKINKNVPALEKQMKRIGIGITGTNGIIYDVYLEKLASHEPVSQYRHNVSEDNADAHMKRQIMGRETRVRRRRIEITSNPVNSAQAPDSLL
jgi:hypothetical protein